MNDVICECGHSINKHYLDRPSNGEASGYCTHYDNENHVFCNCVNSPGEIVAALRARVEELESDEIRRIAIESRMIIENIQKLLGVYTTTEALSRIVELQNAAALAAKGAG